MAMAFIYTAALFPGLSSGHYWTFTILWVILLYALAARMDHPLPWLAIIPVANLWLELDLGGLPWWVLLVLLIPFAGPYLLMIGVAMSGVSIASQLGKPPLAGALLAVPPLNLLVLAWFAFSD